MLITINSVVVTTADKGYQIAEVKYLKDGKPEAKKIMSFAAPAVFAALQNLKNFPVNVEVTVKKEGAYWNWKEVSTNTTGEQSSGATAKPAGKVTGSNYETSEERARRQIYIIRQSSVSSAIEYLKATSPKGAEKSVEEVLEIARAIEAYVVDLNPTTDVPV